jgi:hypothetical protein
MPQKWEYYYDIGFVYYWRLHDVQTAATWFRRAAVQPGAPNWLPPLAASMLSRGQDRAAARFMWQQILTSEEEWLRRSAERALVQLRALDEIDRLDAIVRGHPPAAGEPYSWPALVRQGALARAPADPTGVPFELDPVTGQVTVSSQSPIYPMPESRPLP